MTPKPAESAVERYFIETTHHDRTRYTELNKVPGTTHCLITTADAALAELKAENEALRREVERLKCCGNCASHGFDSAYDSAESFCVACLREWERNHYHDFDGWTKKSGPWSWTEVDPSDHCHFTPSRWQEREA